MTTSIQAPQTGIITLTVSLVQERMETEIARTAEKMTGLYTFMTGGEEIEADYFGAEAIQEAASTLDGSDNTSEDVIVDVVQRLRLQKAAGRGSTL
jgi:hypothetical protein